MKQAVWLTLTMLFVVVWVGAALGADSYCASCNGASKAAMMQAYGAPACCAPGYGMLVPGCCDCPPSCCDDAWAGYCEEKARVRAWLDSLGKPRCAVYTPARSAPRCAVETAPTAAERPIAEPGQLGPAPQPSASEAADVPEAPDEPHAAPKKQDSKRAL
jgi:hypothetical protein